MKQTILLVEDDENDVLFMQHAFQEAEVLAGLQVAIDGMEAIEYLDGNGKYADRELFPFPDLILLDLKLPRMMGFEVLKCIRGRAELKNLIVVILSSSNLALDVEKAYQLGVNAYLVKPSSLSGRAAIATAIKLFWLELNQGPAKRAKSAKLMASVK
jgi:CheY-like chemotaxis protein